MRSIPSLFAITIALLLISCSPAGESSRLQVSGSAGSDSTPRSIELIPSNHQDIPNPQVHIDLATAAALDLMQRDFHLRYKVSAFNAAYAHGLRGNELRGVVEDMAAMRTAHRNEYDNAKDLVAHVHEVISIRTSIGKTTPQTLLISLANDLAARAIDVQLESTYSPGALDQLFGVAPMSTTARDFVNSLVYGEDVWQQVKESLPELAAESEQKKDFLNRLVMALDLNKTGQDLVGQESVETTANHVSQRLAALHSRMGALDEAMITKGAPNSIDFDAIAQDIGDSAQILHGVADFYDWQELRVASGAVLQALKIRQTALSLAGVSNFKQRVMGVTKLMTGVKGLMGMFAGLGGGSNALILEQLQKIGEFLESMNKGMHARFDAIDWALADIAADLKDLKTDVKGVHAQLNELTKITVVLGEQNRLLHQRTYQELQSQSKVMQALATSDCDWQSPADSLEVYKSCLKKLQKIGARAVRLDPIAGTNAVSLLATSHALTVSHRPQEDLALLSQTAQPVFGLSGLELLTPVKQGFPVTEAWRGAAQSFAKFRKKNSTFEQAAMVVNQQTAQTLSSVAETIRAARRFLWQKGEEDRRFPILNFLHKYKELRTAITKKVYEERASYEARLRERRSPHSRTALSFDQLVLKSDQKTSRAFRQELLKDAPLKHCSDQNRFRAPMGLAKYTALVDLIPEELVLAHYLGLGAVDYCFDQVKWHGEHWNGDRYWGRLALSFHLRFRFVGSDENATIGTFHAIDSDNYSIGRRIEGGDPDNRRMEFHQETTLEHAVGSAKDNRLQGAVQRVQVTPQSLHNQDMLADIRTKVLNTVRAEAQQFYTELATDKERSFTLERQALDAARTIFTVFVRFTQGDDNRGAQLTAQVGTLMPTGSQIFRGRSCREDASQKQQTPYCGVPDLDYLDLHVASLIQWADELVKISPNEDDFTETKLTQFIRAQASIAELSSAR